MASTILNLNLLKSETFVSLLLRLGQIVLLALIGWTMARAILLWTNPESAWTATPQVTAASGVSNNGTTPQSFEFTSDPFKVMTSEESVQTGQPIYDLNLDVPETSLDIKVKGWIAGKGGSASLQTPDNREASYQVGEDVMDGVTLQAVTRRYVVLDVQGELQRLTFARDTEDKLLATSTDIKPVTTPQARNASSGNQVRAQLSAADFLKVARLNPKFDQGRLVGHVIQSRGDEAVLTHLGLSSGDVVTAINGDSLIQGRLDFQELALTLQNAGTVRLDIIRDGRARTVKIGQ